MKDIESMKLYSSSMKTRSIKVLSDWLGKKVLIELPKKWIQSTDTDGKANTDCVFSKMINKRDDQAEKNMAFIKFTYATQLVNTFTH